MNGITHYTHPILLILKALKFLVSKLMSKCYGMKKIYMFSLDYLKNIFGLTLKLEMKLFTLIMTLKYLLTLTIMSLAMEKLKLMHWEQNGICFWINHIDLVVKLIQVGIFKD